MTINTRGVVIGGGVIGLSLAWDLARRGHSITVVERGTLGRATSWAAAGILPPANFSTATDPLDALRGLSHEMFPRWHEELLAKTGIDSGLRRCGGWYLASTPGERAAMIGMRDYWTDLDIQCDPTVADEVARREPSLAGWAQANNRDQSAWWVPDEYQIRSPRYLQALTQACRLAGVTLIENAPVHDLQSQEAHVKVQSSTQSIEADFAVVTSGVWSGRVAESLNLKQALIPVRGQILLLQTSAQPLESIVNVGNRYLVPRDDGLMLVGSNEEEVGFETGTTPHTLDSLHQFARDLCPHLRDASVVHAWSGLRPMTFDGFPMIGRVPDFANVFVAAGHYRSGIHLSCGTAVVVANLVEGRDNVVDLAAFQVSPSKS